MSAIGATSKNWMI